MDRGAGRYDELAGTDAAGCELPDAARRTYAGQDGTFNGRRRILWMVAVCALA